ncbi:MAG TPA: murein L,D-transpeptidase catalytic domain family protein [Candidatus Limnocylindria bacterium]|nr:murein L,D-transpeptidase catalytic domain family protein [Candidatus Limnocylindria bacterium]
MLGVVLIALAGSIGCARPVAARNAMRPPVPARTMHAVPPPRPEVLELALRAYECGRSTGEVRGPLLTVIDYSLPSTERRLWVIDVPRRRVLFHELVAHGENSGYNLATAFSNRIGSRQSSLGLFRTADTYIGGHGVSLRLEGLEPGVNDRAMERRIVMHGADYVDENIARTLGRLGRSWGCPALPRASSRRVIERIKDGNALFAYYPDPRWLEQSRFLRCDGVRLAQN